jgi:tRNA (guanine37-N1)-methyltransferase
LKPEPLFEAVESLLGVGVSPTGRREDGEGNSNSEVAGASPRGGTVSLQNEAISRSRSGTAAQGTPIAPAGAAIVLLSASGKLFRQETARRFAQLERIVLLCGRYEGVDERVAEHLATDEVSIGDFVLSGGELAAALVVDTVTRLIPGALGNDDSSVNESFSAAETRNVPPSPFASAQGKPVALQPDSGQANHSILDFPHYTRPAEFRGWQVPEILIGGNHEEIRRWRRQKALEKTQRNRPDLLASGNPNWQGG